MKFDRDYQDSLLAKLCDDSFMFQCGPLLQPDVFVPELQDLVSEVLQRYSDNAEVLSRPQLKQLGTTYGVSIPSAVNTPHAFDRAELVRFVKHSEIRLALAEAHVANEGGDFDEAVERVLRAKERFPAAPSDAIEDVLSSNASLAGITRTGCISTGLHHLDSVLGGGPGGGDLGILLAPTSGGKTSLLCYLGSTALGLGLKVFHVTLEVPSIEVVRKYRAALTGLSKSTDRQWNDIRSKMSKKGGKLMIQEYPPGTVSMWQMEKAMPKDVDLLIIDYGDYVKPSYSTGKKHEDLGKAFEEMKRVGMARHIPVWTASQINRNGYDKNVADLEDVAGSIEKCFIADQVVSINPKGANDLTLFVAKNRHGGRDHQVKVKVDFATCSFTETGVK